MNTVHKNNEEDMLDGESTALSARAIGIYGTPKKETHQS